MNALNGHSRRNCKKRPVPISSRNCEKVAALLCCKMQDAKRYAYRQGKAVHGNRDNSQENNRFRRCVRAARADGLRQVLI